MLYLNQLLRGVYFSKTALINKNGSDFLSVKHEEEWQIEKNAILSKKKNNFD